MESVTVRRWVGAPPDEVWSRVLDLPRLVVDDHRLDLEDVVGELDTGIVPALGTRATVTRRHGVRVERLVLHVVDREEGEHVVISVRTGGERWLATITLEAMPGDRSCGTDVRLHAERDRSTGRTPGPRSLAAGRRTAHRIGELLDALAHQLDRAPRGAADRQRIAAGR